jgi:hypothetical protein
MYVCIYVCMHSCIKNLSRKVKEKKKKKKGIEIVIPLSPYKPPAWSYVLLYVRINRDRDRSRVREEM